MPSPRSRKYPSTISIFFFFIVRLDELRVGPYGVLTTRLEDKLVMAVAGYPALYMVLSAIVTMKTAVLEVN